MIARNAAVLAFTIVCLLLSACGGGEADRNMMPVSELKAIKTVPDFSGVSFDGRTVMGADMRGRVWIAYFFFTSCGGPCPKMSSLASVLNTQFADERDFRIVSFTVD